MRRFLFALIAAAVPLAAQSVMLSVPAIDDVGSPVLTGDAYVNWSPFLDNSGNLVPGGSRHVSIANGLLSVTLSASDNAGYVYKVLVQGGTRPSASKWRVPAAGASSFAQLTQTLPTQANALSLDLSQMTCAAPIDGVLRRVAGSAGESVQVCLSSYSGWWRSLTAALQNARSQVVRVRIFGDSMSQCWGAASNPMSNCPGIGPVNHSHLWVEQLRSWLNSMYPSHGSGVLPFVTGVNSIGKGEYSVSGTPNFFPVNVPSQQGPASAGSAGLQLSNGQSVSNIVSHDADSLNLYFVTYTFGTNQGSGSGFTVSVDGGAAASYGGGASPALTSRMVTVPLTRGSHTMRLTCASDACYVYAAEWTIGTSGVSVDDMAVAACRAECFAGPSSLSMADLVAATSPANFDLLFLGTNDYLHGTLPAYQSNMAAIVSHELSLGASVLISSEPWSSTPSDNGVSQAAINAAAAQLAAANGLDYNALPSSSTFNSAAAQAAFLQDGIHMNDAGHDAMFANIRAHLTTVGYGWFGLPLGASLGIQ